MDNAISRVAFVTENGQGHLMVNPNILEFRVESDLWQVALSAMQT